MTDDKEQPSKPKTTRINIDLPKDLKAAYANLSFISFTPAEIVLDFAQILPKVPRGTVVSRVIMSPMHAKLLQMALAQNVANYERQFGEIRVPQQRANLADDFFRFPEGGGDEEDDKKDE